MDSNEIKQLIAGLLERMQISVTSIEATSLDNRDGFSVNTPDSHLLIGTRGANLYALNHLVRRMVSQKDGTKRTASASRADKPEERAFFIDVNGYQEGMIASVKNVAKIMGERARSFKTNVELEPMSSYERMVVHSFFEEVEDLTTESVGEGERRRIVIKYTGE